MSSQLESYLYNWPKAYIRDQDLFGLYADAASKRYDAVKYAIRQGLLVKIRKGLYLIQIAGKNAQYEAFELAQVIYGPSYVSLESALSYHGWIPEAVYTTTSVTTRRRKSFKTAVGVFSYQRATRCIFYAEVERIQADSIVFLLAKPWKALADMIYLYKKNWVSLNDIYLDLRIESDSLLNSDMSSLHKVISCYQHQHTQKILLNILRLLENES